MPCSPSDVSLAIPSGPSGPAIPGFGIPFSLTLPNLNPFPPGFPEDLLSLLDLLKLLIPSGPLLPQLNLNFGKDVFDAIMKLLDQFMPFLMLYKFFLPVLELIMCIIEVLCALINPFKLVSALIKLFTQCIPAFLALFPIFALIIMIISLIKLIIALIIYIVQQILKLVILLLREILALQHAFQDGDINGVLAIANKLGATLCIFQNLFVLLALFGIIIKIIKDILGLAFTIPPCEDSNPDGCCTPDVCPTIVKNPYTRNTGTLKYLPQVGLSPTLPTPLPPAFAALFNFNIRNESWQIYDVDQNIAQAFSNIYDGYDVVGLIDPVPVFFPTTAIYSALTPPAQAPYTIDLRLFYNPADWGRNGVARYIRFKNCIMTQVPTPILQEGDLTPALIFTAVAQLAGGTGYEDDGKTHLRGFKPDGVTLLTPVVNATLENFLHQPAVTSPNPTLSASDGYTFSDITYTFTPNQVPLVQHNLITLGCFPDLAISKAFINNVYAGDVALKTQELRDIVNGPNFPNPDVAQQCLTTAIATLRSNMTADGVANFQTTATLCLQKLQDDCNTALNQVIGIGFDPCQSSFTAVPPVQFTSKPIKVTVDLNERNALSLTNGVPATAADQLALQIKPHITFGEISNFTFDGYQSFVADLTSTTPGSGQIMISFANNIFCTNTLPPLGSPSSVLPTHTLQAVDYQFVYTPVSTAPPVVPTAEGDTTGQPRRDGGDLSGDGGGVGRDGS